MKYAKAEKVFLGLGSNVGDRRANLSSATRAIASIPGTTLVRSSRVYETAPWGVDDQEAYYNCAVEVATELQPEELIRELQAIERALGRIEAPRYAPRVIDIDILLYGETITSLEHLRIPHPMIAQRRFVLAPLNEIAAGAMHPVEGVTVSELARICGDDSAVRDTGIRLDP